MNIVKKFLIGNEENLAKKEVSWNAIASTLNAGISALLVLIVTRFSGVDQAGIFSIAFAISQMMQMIGYWGMRNFQSTDAEEKYSFSNYLNSRVISCILMIVFSFIYTILVGYEFEKAMIVISLCFLRISDSVNDVYEGMYQKHHRLDVGGKIWTIRVVLYTVVFTISLWVTQNLLLSCILLTISSSVVFVFLAYIVRDKFEKGTIDLKDKIAYRLLKECLPLFIGSFLLVYISNAPKYAIDAQMGSDIQTYYTILFMPCFVINLFASFIIKPLLIPLSSSWYTKNHNKFLKFSLLLLSATIGLTVLIVIMGYFAGCEILSFVYGVDIVQYRIIFTVLLIGGGIYTLSNILQLLLTVMRYQKYLIVGFFSSSVLAYIICPILVEKYEIAGAAFAYVLTSLLMLIIFSVIFVFKFLKEKEIRN